MKAFLFLVTDGKGAIDEKLSFLTNDRDKALEEFGGAKKGIVSVIDLSMARPLKRMDFNVTHHESEDSLPKLSDVKLRSEAKKRKLEVAENQLATRGDIIHAIQQHDLLKGSAERDAAVAGQAREQLQQQAEVTGAPVFEEKMTVAELRDFAGKNNIDLPAKGTKGEIIDAIEKANVPA